MIEKPCTKNRRHMLQVKKLVSRHHFFVSNFAMKRPQTTSLQEEGNKKMKLDSYQNKPKTQEHQVGIIQYILYEGPSLTGQLKVRYSDFIVNEIDQQNKVVTLHSTQVPEELVLRKYLNIFLPFY